jgi:hypothetical protein
MSSLPQQTYTTQELVTLAVRGGYQFRTHTGPLPRGESIVLFTSLRLAVVAPGGLLADRVELRKYPDGRIAAPGAIIAPEVEYHGRQLAA